MTISAATKQAINHWLQTEGLGTVQQLSPVSGGCISDNFRLQTTCGTDFFVKTQQLPPQGIFAAEAAGLLALAQQSPLRVPRVYAHQDSFLLMEYIAPGQPGRDFWNQLADGLATLHSQSAAQFGFPQDNYCGLTPQLNQPCDDGNHFFGEQRLRYQGERALHSRLLPRGDFERLRQLIDKLPELIPKQPATLIHGDLWSGNIHCDTDGNPVLIDPAAYWGWREADIAMTQLFGQLPQTFYQRYQSQLPMPGQWQQRMPLYNLYHLLNHLNLFGRSYLPQVQQVIKSYL